jgi:hypothetical protein
LKEKSMSLEKEPKSCPLAQEGPSWLLGQLSREEAVAFERHLAGCPNCMARVADYRKIADGLAGMAPVPLERDLAPLVLDCLGENAWPDDAGAAQPMVRRRRFLAVELAAATAILVGLGAAVLLLPRLEHRPPPAGPVVQSPVPSALQWLAKTQDASGAWKPGAFGGSDTQTLGVTSLVLYSFLKHPDVEKDHYAATIRRGIQYVVRHERPDGFIGTSMSEHPTREQGLATLALVRAAAQLKEAPVVKAANAALARILETQSADGSWGHAPREGALSDVTVTVWHLHALIEAETSGWKGLRPSIERGLAWLKATRLAEGRDAYARAGNFPYGLPPTSDAGRLFLLADMRGGTREAKQLPLDDPLRAYFVTRGLSALDDANALTWVRNLRGLMADRQVKSGTEAGSWEASDPAGGRVGSTALATLAFD